MTNTKRFLSGRQIDQLHQSKDKAQELQELIENLPSWIFQREDAPKLWDSLAKVRAILNTAEEVSK